MAQRIQQLPVVLAATFCCAPVRQTADAIKPETPGKETDAGPVFASRARARPQPGPEPCPGHGETVFRVEA